MQIAGLVRLNCISDWNSIVFPSISYVFLSQNSKRKAATKASGSTRCPSFRRMSSTVYRFVCNLSGGFCAKDLQDDLCNSQDFKCKRRLRRPFCRATKYKHRLLFRYLATHFYFSVLADAECFPGVSDITLCFETVSSPSSAACHGSTNLSSPVSFHIFHASWSFVIDSLFFPTDFVWASLVWPIDRQSLPAVGPIEASTMPWATKLCAGSPGRFVQALGEGSSTWHSSHVSESLPCLSRDGHF